MNVPTAKTAAAQWAKARDEAFEAGRCYVPTNFAPKWSRHARVQGAR